MELDKILKWTLRDVIQESGNKQVPWIHQKIFDDFYLSEKEQESPKFEPIPEPKQKPKIEKTPYQFNQTETVKTADKVTPTVKKESSKNLYFVLLFLGVLLIGGGYYFTTKPNIQPNLETASYKIYNDYFVDKKTDLYWENKTSSNVKQEYTWEEAKNYCSNLKNGGFTDWRLPTQKEAKTLLTEYYGEWGNYDEWKYWFYNNKHKRNNERFVKKEISKLVPMSIWTKDTYKSNSSGSWVVDFDLGDDGWDYHGNGYFIVCVRDF